MKEKEKASKEKLVLLLMRIRRPWAFYTLFFVQHCGDIAVQERKKYEISIYRKNGYINFMASANEIFQKSVYFPLFLVLLPSEHHKFCMFSTYKKKTKKTNDTGDFTKYIILLFVASFYGFVSVVHFLATERREGPSTTGAGSPRW